MPDEMPEQLDERQSALLARYVSGRASTADESEVHGWMAGDPARAELVASLKEIWEQGRRSRAAWDVNASWQELRARHDTHRESRDVATPRFASEKSRESPRRPTRASPLRHRSRTTSRHRTGTADPTRRGARRATPRWHVPASFVRAAAVLVIAAGGTALWALLSGRLTDASSDGSAVAMREYRTEPGRRGDLRLSDGTRVFLNVDSRVLVPENYGRRSRDVQLEGEAMFEVEHDERRPFRVHAAGVVAEDLGTRFGVRGYAEDEAVTVVVAEGIVELKRAMPSRSASPSQSAGARVLEPGDLGRVTAAGDVQIDRDVNVADHLAWTTGRLVFDDMPLAEAAPQLGRWYRLEVQLADPALGERRLTASFQHEPISRVLALVTMPLGLRYERDGNVVTFYDDSAR